MNLEEYDFGELRNEKEWRRCAPDTNDPEALLKGFIYFCETYWHIRHPSRGRIKFELFDAQIETVRSWLSTRYSLILKARQIGFSTLVAAYAYWLAFFYPDRPILMLSRTEREAIKLLAKAKYGRQFLPEWMDFRGGPCNVTQTKLEFTNGSYIESLPSASDPARGESAYLVVVDEMAFLPNSEEAWSAIEPVADVGGRVIMLSTANGEGNLFHKLWIKTSTGSNRFTPLFFPYTCSGISIGASAMTSLSSFNVPWSSTMADSSPLSTATVVLPSTQPVGVQRRAVSEPVLPSAPTYRRAGPSLRRSRTESYAGPPLGSLVQAVANKAKARNARIVTRRVARPRPMVRPWSDHLVTTRDSSYRTKVKRAWIA